MPTTTSLSTPLCPIPTERLGSRYRDILLFKSRVKYAVKCHVRDSQRRAGLTEDMGETKEQQEAWVKDFGRWIEGCAFHFYQTFECFSPCPSLDDMRILRCMIRRLERAFRTLLPISEHDYMTTFTEAALVVVRTDEFLDGEEDQRPFALLLQQIYHIESRLLQIVGVQADWTAANTLAERIQKLMRCMDEVTVCAYTGELQKLYYSRRLALQM